VAAFDADLWPVQAERYIDQISLLIAFATAIRIVVAVAGLGNGLIQSLLR